MQGQVKFFNAKRGFGFISAEGQDYFVHISTVEGTEPLLEGERVEFKAVESIKGHQALDVVRLQPPTLQEEEGVVKIFYADKGFGFISRSGKADVFVHLDSVEGGASLEAGQRVSFLTRAQRDGRDRAYTVRVLG